MSPLFYLEALFMDGCLNNLNRDVMVEDPPFRFLRFSTAHVLEDTRQVSGKKILEI
jgi:very-short-patch-repair endonuclease